MLMLDAECWKATNAGLDFGRCWCSRSPLLQFWLRPRMKLPVHSLKPLLIDMRVHLGRGNIGMPQHFLNNPQISAVPEQMRSETVPKKVWIDIFLQPRAARMLFYNLPDTGRG